MPSSALRIPLLNHSCSPSFSSHPSKPFCPSFPQVLDRWLTCYMPVLFLRLWSASLHAAETLIKCFLWHGNVWLCRVWSLEGQFASWTLRPMRASCVVHHKGSRLGASLCEIVCVCGGGVEISRFWDSLRYKHGRFCISALTAYTKS